MKNALILYPHQLFPVDQLPEVQTVVVVEEPILFGLDQHAPQKFHKQKIILHRASLRRYVEEILWPAGMQVDYVELDVFANSGDVLERVKSFDHVYIFDPVDEVLTQRLLQARRERKDGPPVDFLPNPNFYLKEQEVREYFGNQHKAFAGFYQWQRERFNILIGSDYKPEGGKWMFDVEAHTLPKGQVLPSFAAFGDNKHVHEAVKWADEHFPDHPGGTDFIWPTSHSEAAIWLKDFVDNRLDNFAKYQDAMDSDAPWLFHSALSASINTGLLSPQQVVEAALARHAAKPVDIKNLENFVRQILGWREFVRGQYLTHGSTMRAHNEFKNLRRMTPAWFEGSLGIPPFDNIVHKLHKHAYAHQAERVTIAAGLMLIAEIHPEDIQRWFNELLIDSYEWVLLPNLYSISQFTDPDSKIAIGPSNNLLEMSNYDRGEWSDVWDGLYWRFIEKHKETFKHNSRMRAVVQRLDRLDSDRKRIIGYRADDFLKEFTR